VPKSSWEKYKGQSEASVIGHFGLGFYSSFMISSQVEVFTKAGKMRRGSLGM
jgi:molecular chaperone HtpG